jgi:WD repeat-containing protein 61
MFQTKQKISDVHDEGIWCLSWCQGSLVTGSLDGTIACNDILDAKNAKFRSSSASIGVTSLITLLDGSMAVACYQDSTLRFFDLFNDKEVECIDPGIMEAYGISISPGEDILVSGSLKGYINVWSMQEGHEKVASFETKSKFILTTAFSLDGKLATGGMDGMVNIFDMSTQQAIHKFDAHAMPARSVVFSPEGSCVFSASDDHQVNIFDVRSRNLVQAFSHESMAFAVDVSPDGRRFLVGCSSGQVSLWDLGMQRRQEKYDDHNDIVWSVQFDKSAGGSRFASCSDDASVQVYERRAASS